MDEITPAKTPTKRRHYSKQFKAQILAACEQPGTSVASVALSNGLNANLVHKWRRQASRQSPVQPDQPDFLPMPLSPSSTHCSSDNHVLIEIANVRLHWPIAHIDHSIGWLRLLQA